MFIISCKLFKVFFINFFTVYMVAVFLLSLMFYEMCSLYGYAGLCKGVLFV